MEAENQGRGMPHLAFQLQEQNANTPTCSEEYLGFPSGKAICRKTLRAAVRTSRLRSSVKEEFDAAGLNSSSQPRSGLESISKPMKCNGWRHSRAQPRLYLCVPRQRGAVSVTSILVSMRSIPLLWGSHLVPKTCGNCFFTSRGKASGGLTRSHNQ